MSLLLESGLRLSTLFTLLSAIGYIAEMSK